MTDGVNFVGSDRSFWGLSAPDDLHASATVVRLDDYRRFDAGAPGRCYRCDYREGVRRIAGDGGSVWACRRCPHPAD